MNRFAAANVNATFGALSVATNVPRWSLTGSYSPSNPYVNVAKVEELIKKSVARRVS